MAIVTLPLPNQIADGQTADAVPLMANMNYIANQVNANAYSPPTSSLILDTAYGYQSINTGLTTNQNTAFGYATLRVVTGAQNTAFGYVALLANTTGTQNTAIGGGALSTAISVSDNTAVGFQAMANSTGATCTAVGANALLANTGASNVAIGYQAMFSSGSGTQNTAVGTSALFALTNGNNNVAVGYQAGEAITSGGSNTMIGWFAGAAISTQLSNVVIGSQAMYQGVASNTVAIGHFCMNSASLSSTQNVAIGDTALGGLTTGTNNTAVGYSALSANSTFSDCSGLGSNSAVTGASQVQLGDAATTTYAYGAVQNRSDARDKADIRDTTLGLPFINSLRPVDYKWDMREDYRTDQSVPLHDIKTDGSKKRSRFHHGFIAQEVHAASMGQFGGVQHHAINGGHDVWSIGEGELIAPLVKAVQELSAELAALKAKG